MRDQKIQKGIKWLPTKYDPKGVMWFFGLEGNARKRVISKDANLSFSMVSATIVENPSTPLPQRCPLQLLLLLDSCNPHHFCLPFLLSLAIKYIQTRNQLIFYVTFQVLVQKYKAPNLMGCLSISKKKK